MSSMYSDNLPELLSPKANRRLYEARLKEWRDNKSRIDGARTEGMQKGMQKVFALLERGYSLPDAKKKLGLE